MHHARPSLIKPALAITVSALAMTALLVAACNQQKSAEGTGQPKKDDLASVTPTTEEKAMRDYEAADEIAAEPAPMPTGAPIAMATRAAPMAGMIGGEMDSAAYLPPPENTEKYPDASPNPQKVVADEPVSTFSIDVDTASYGVMRSYVSGGALPPRDSVRVEEFVNYFDYNYAPPKTHETPFATHVQVYPTPWNKDTLLMHIGIKGYEIKPEKRPASNLVFLLDVSGSMDEPNKLPLLKQSIRMLVNELGPDDTVAMVVYAGAAGTVLDPTKGDQKAKILAALDNLSAGGSTAGGEGIRQAYELAKLNFAKDKVNRILLATDGDFNVGIDNPERLEDFVAHERESGVYLTVLGFGRDNYNDAMMQTLAQAGNGNAAYIDTLNEARKVLVDEMSSTLFPIANDVKIQVEFNPSQVAEYRLIGYETRILDKTDFNNDKVDAGDIGAGHSVTALYEIVPVGSKAALVDPSRYEKPAATDANKSGEFAFLKLRYKLPGGTTSKLIEQPIMAKDALAKFEDASEDTRFAAAVAAYAQILKGDTHIKDMSLSDIVDIAQKAKGDDPFGYRAEFVNLVRNAQTAPALPPLEQPTGALPD